MSNSHLIVGLGGNGGKIIRELRKTIERSTEDGATEVRFDFVYIDTSEDELAKTDDWKVLGKDIDLERSQYLINKSSQVRPVLEDPGSFPGLSSWIEPRDVFDFVNATTAGAAQKRKLGRVVFAQNAARFVATFEQRMNALESRAGKVGAVIHVVCGLAGGTGSGSLIDAVAQIRQRYPDPDQYRILIYALLPERNASPAKAKSAAGYSNYYANAYAALSELNAMAVGKYHPENVLGGGRLKHDLYFNGCYLVNNINEHGVQFEVDQEVPRIVAEFIYQKTLNMGWEGLGRAEKGENDVKNFESDSGIGKARAKLFLSFGIERVVVPEEEIKEFMAYGFAEQATRQLMFNNFRQGEGFAEEAVQKDWRSEVRKPEVAQALLLTDAHLTLEAGILEDDQKNALWKPIRDYWKQIVARLSPEIQADKNTDQTMWISVLQSRLGKVYDETYRTLGGVAKFYETKSKARLEMARHIGAHVERDLFAKWRSGESSLMQLRQFMDALLELLDERLGMIQDAISKGPGELQKVHTRLAELSGKFNGVGFLGKHLTDKRESLFADIAALYQDLSVVRTTLEGQKFAAGLIPFVKEELTALRGTIDELQQKIGVATERVALERAAQLGDAEAVYQKRIFDKGAINTVMKAMTIDEQSQVARTQQVRRAIIDLAGTETDAFGRLNKSVTVTNLVSTLSQESARIVELAHAELGKTLQPVLHVNIVDRLSRQYDANPAALKSFVAGLYDDAGCMLRFDKTEVDRTVEGNAGGSSGRVQTIGVFLPECEAQRGFRDALADQFEKQKTPGAETRIQVGKFSNQIAVMKISSLMPARFIDGLKDLKHHYDGLLADRIEAYLLHGEGDGRHLPPLYARSAKEIADAALQRPTLVAAKLLNFVKQRQNKTTGLQEWVFVRFIDDLPVTTVLPGREWTDVQDGELSDDTRAAIAKAVKDRIATEYKHVDRKLELDSAFKQMARERFAAAGDDDEDAQYQALLAMRPIFLKSIVGMP